MNPQVPSAGSNPPAGGSGTSPTTANPPAGGQPFPTPASAGMSPAGAAGSNPPAGGSGSDQNAAPSDDNAPISADVFREKMRSEAALRKRVQELEAREREREDAKLTEQERQKKQLEEYQQKEAEWLIERQESRMQRVVDAHVREKNLVDADVIQALLTRFYADQMDYDEDGIPTNAANCINSLIQRFPYLVVQQQPAQQQQPAGPPGSGRQLSPPRTPTGQYAPLPPRQPAQAQQPVPPASWPSLGQLTDADWAALREEQRNRGQY